MPMINCKVVDDDGEVESVIDIDNGFRIETNVKNFNTTVTDDDGVYAYIEHEDLETSLECQRQLSKAIHF